MTDREIMQQALEALDNHNGNYKLTVAECNAINKVCDNLRQALAQPEHPLDKKAENARELGLDYEVEHGFDRTASHMAGEYVDTAGTEHQFKYVAYGLRADENGKLSIGEISQREWVGLTDDEIKKIVDLNTSDDGGFDIWCDGIAVAHIVCAKLKEKNT